MIPDKIANIYVSIINYYINVDKKCIVSKEDGVNYPFPSYKSKTELY